MSDGDKELPGAEPEADAAAAAEKEKAAAAAKAKAEAAAKAKAAKAAAEAAKPPWERDPSAPELTDASEVRLVRGLVEAHGDSIVDAKMRGDELVIHVAPAGIREVCATLRRDEGFTLLVDICGAHHPKLEETPYEVIYHVFSLDANRRVRLRVALADGETLPSVCPVWAGANWMEREAYDMYGIRFDDHPDMTRILLWEGFNGYPLRKDFPVEGIDTGAAIYPEYYGDQDGPTAGTGTGWKPPAPPEPPAEEPADAPAEEASDS